MIYNCKCYLISLMIDTTYIVSILIVFRFLHTCLVMALYHPETKLSGMKYLVGKSVLKFRQLLSTICIIFTIYSNCCFIIFFWTYKYT